MSKVQFTEEQQNAINSKGRVLVSAAAGSGKTAVLVERVAKTILDMSNKVPADELLVVTFTNAAASEMKNRISARISKEIEKDPANSWYVKQKHLLSKASICTTDSFCMNLVREYFYMIDFEPDFKIASGDFGFDEIFSMLVSKYMDDEAFIKLVKMLGTDDAIENLKGVIADLHKYVCSLPSRKKYFDYCRALYNDFDINNSIWVDTVLNAYSDEIKELLADFKHIKPEFEQSQYKNKVQSIFDGCYEFVSSMANAIDKQSWQTAYNAVMNGSVKSTTAKSKDEFELEQELKSLFSSAKTVFDSIKKDICESADEIADEIKLVTPCANTLFDFAEEFEDALFSFRKSKNSYDFSDIEYMALKLLMNEDGSLTDIAKELSSRYREVMVDEFQDTNDLQNTIFSALSNNGEKQFAVGDVKQCIYGFRRANPSLFLKLKNRLAPYDKTKAEKQSCKVIMSGNFRSDKRICDYVNFIFSNFMSKKMGQMTYDEEDYLNAHIDFGESNMPRVQLDVVDVESSNELADVVEYRHIAEYIKSVVGKLTLGKENDRRTTKFSDITVLCRTGSTVSKIGVELKKCGIPVSCAKKDSFFDERETVIALALLSVIDNPKNDYQLLVLLMSELFGFSAEQIASIRVINKKSDLYSCVVMSTNNEAKAFVKTLSAYRALATELDLASFCTRVFSLCGLNNIARAFGGGASLANLHKIIKLASEYDENSIGGLTGFLRYLNIMAAKKADAEPYTPDSDCVKVMTMHNSKGLQFPICICAGLNKHFESQVYPIARQSEKCGFGLKAIDPLTDLRFYTLPYSAAKIELNETELAEEMRILYVAMTRAEEHLILSGTYKKPARNNQSVFQSKHDKFSRALERHGKITMSVAKLCKSPLDILVAASLIKNKDVEYEMNIITSEDVSADVVNEEVTEFSANENELQQLKDRLCYVYPYELVNKIAAKQSASRIAHEDENADYSCSAVPLFLQQKRLSATARGTAMHKLMQYIDLNCDVDKIDEEFERIKSLEIFSNDEFESLEKQKIVSFLQSDLCAKMKAADEIYFEREFMVELAATEIDDSLPDELSNEFVVIQGAVDCAFISGKKLCIVDYKTDYVTDLEQLRQKYAKQLIIYEKALRQIYDVNECELVIYSFALSDKIII